MDWPGGFRNDNGFHHPYGSRKGERSRCFIRLAVLDIVQRALAILVLVQWRIDRYRNKAESQREDTPDDAPLLVHPPRVPRDKRYADSMPPFIAAIAAH